MTMKLEKIREEKAVLLVPAGASDDPFHKSAFYNPRMSFNRSMASVGLGALMQLMPEKTLVDGLAGTGARGIRYATDNPGIAVTFIEANPDAVKLLKQNIKANKLKKTKIAGKKFHEFVASADERYDFVELDPFGTPAFFLEGASMLLGKSGIISATGTDLAKLCGNEPATCIRNYSSKPMRCEFSHEIAVRILLKKMAEALALRDYGITPLFCFYQGHAIKAMVLCEKSSAKADFAMKQFAYANLCSKCGSRWFSDFPEACKCGGKTNYAGPMWKGKLNDAEIVKKAIEINEKRNYTQKEQLRTALTLMLEENDMQPLFYSVHELSKLWKVHSPKSDELLAQLRKAGFTASYTHFSPTGFRTNAPVAGLKKAFDASLKKQNREI
jgi:tRNA (guanine26-N2/guanine27-N2)-dimethyltransferase